MLQRLRKRIDLPSAPADVNMLPLMNIIMLLIPFLILSTQFIKVGAIDVSAPPIQDTREPLPPKPITTPQLNLTVSVTRKGFTLMTRKGRIAPGCRLDGVDSAKDGPTIPKRGAAFPLTALQTCLTKIKQSVPTETRMVLMAEPAVEYQTIINVMDVSRSYGKARKALFPNVALSAGVL